MQMEEFWKIAYFLLSCRDADKRIDVALHSKYLDTAKKHLAYANIMNVQTGRDSSPGTSWVPALPTDMRVISVFLSSCLSNKAKKPKMSPNVELFL